mgnify:CR=1 FL=1
MQTEKTAAEILALPSFRTMSEFIPEWDCEVEVTSYSKAVEHKIRDQVVDSNPQSGRKVNLDRMEKLMFVHAVTKPRFTLEQYDALMDKDCVPLNRVMRLVYLVTGMTAVGVTATEKSFPLEQREGSTV